MRATGPRAFMLRVECDLARAPSSHGDAVLVDPDVAPEPGDAVIVLTRDNKLLLRKLKAARRGRYYFRAAYGNQHGADINHIDAAAEICGVVVAKWVDDI